MAKSTGRTVLITGGAGFIGSNLAERLLAVPGTRVRIFDNFSRAGVKHNLRWLRSLSGGDQLEVVTGDVRDARAVQRAVYDASAIYHLAAQVAVTSSVTDPAHDFEVNAKGTFNVLEAARRSDHSPFASVDIDQQGVRVPVATARGSVRLALRCRRVRFPRSG